MTGPEHYREAERILENSQGPDGAPPSEKAVARAKVHATLALVAAQAESIVQETLGTENVDLAVAWSEAIS